MSFTLHGLLSILYEDYRVKNNDVVQFEEFIHHQQMDRYALFEDIKQYNDNNEEDIVSSCSSKTVIWLRSNNCYDTMYPLIIEFMSQYLTDPKREKMLSFLKELLEDFASRARYTQSVTYLKDLRSTLSHLFIHQQRFIKNMDDNRLTLNLRYHDEYYQFCPLLFILICRTYNAFNEKHYLQSFEYLNIFQLFVENGANPLKQSQTFGSVHDSMLHILDVLYGLTPMIIKKRMDMDGIVEQFVINKYLSFLIFGKIHDADDLESWFPTILTIKRYTNDNNYGTSTSLSFVNDAFLSPFLYNRLSESHGQNLQKRCIHSIYCLKRLLIRGFHIIDISNNGIIDASVSKSDIIKSICFDANNIHSSISTSQILLLLWVMRILIMEIRDEYIAEFHTVYNLKYDEFKEECGGTAISYSVWLLIMDYGIVNQLHFLNEISDAYFVNNGIASVLQTLSPDIILFVFNNIFTKLSENHLQIIANQLYENRSFAKIFTMLLFENNDKKQDNTIIMKMTRLLLMHMDDTSGDYFLMKRIFDVDLIQIMFWNKDDAYNINDEMLTIYSDMYMLHEHASTQFQFPICTQILNEYLFSINGVDCALSTRIDCLFPSKLMRLRSMQVLHWIFLRSFSETVMEIKLKFAIDRKWIDVLILTLDETNKEELQSILETISNHVLLELLLQYFTASKQTSTCNCLAEMYFDLQSTFCQKGQKYQKCVNIVTKYVRLLHIKRFGSAAWI